MSKAGGEIAEPRTGLVGKDLDELHSVLRHFRGALRHELSDFAETLRKNVQEELDLSSLRALHPEDPWAHRKFDQQPLRESNFDDVVPFSDNTPPQNVREEQKRKGNLSVAWACAAFKTQTGRLESRFPGFHANTTRLPEVAEEMEEVRREVSRARHANEDMERDATESGNRLADKSHDGEPTRRGAQATYSTQMAMLGQVGSHKTLSPAHLQHASKSRRLIGSLLATPHFQNAMALLTVLHSIYIAIASEVMARNVRDETPSIFTAADIFFLFAFAAELGLNLYAHRLDWLRSVTSQGLKNRERMWNFVECLLVASQVVDLILQSIAVTKASQLALLRTLRLARLLRIVRVFKVVRVVQDLRLIIFSMTRSFTVFFWSVVALILSTFFFGMFFTEVVLDYKLRHVERDTRELDKYFGSLSGSMMSLLQAVTGGVDWGEILVQADSLDHPIAAIALIVYICFALFALMNVITGVFLHTALDRAGDEREIQMVSKARDVFAKADKTHNGMITWPDFERAIDAADMREFFDQIDLGASEARNLFDLLDATGDGVVSAEEFLHGCLRLSGAAKAFDLLVLSREVSHLFSQLASYTEKMLENQQLLLRHLPAKGDPKNAEAREVEAPTAMEPSLAEPDLPGMCASPSPAWSSEYAPDRAR